MKPDDVTEGAWVAAIDAWVTAGFINDRLNQVQHFARAIMAAKAEEREACAKIVDETPTPYTKDGRFIASEQNRIIANAIRSRS